MFITYLLEPFALRMHQTEGTYNLVRLNNVRLHVGLSLQQHQSGQQALETVSSIYQYNHQTGTLHVPLAAGDGAAAEAKPIAIAEIEAADRRFPALRQPAMLHLLKHALAHARGRAQHGGSAGGAGGGGQPVGLRHVHVEHHSLSSSGVSAQHPTALTPAAASHPAAAPPAVAVNGEALHDHDHAALDEWVLSYLDDGWLRAACIEHLSASSREFSYDSYDVEMSLGDIFSASVR